MWNKQWNRIFLCLFLVISFSTLRAGAVVGVVMDANSEQPLVGVNILLKQQGGGQSYGAYSTADGSYRIENVQEGTYLLSAWKSGYDNYRGEAITIQAGNQDTQVDFALMPITSLWKNKGDFLPHTMVLKQNYPNPFNPTTQIPFELKQAYHIKLRVYDVLGKIVNDIFEGQLPAGEYLMAWNGKDAAGNAVSSGVYIYSLEYQHFKLTRKMLLNR